PLPAQPLTRDTLLQPLRRPPTLQRLASPRSSGLTGAFSAPAVATTTLANQPASASSTWTYVGITSVTVTWVENGNPLGVTNYELKRKTPVLSNRQSLRSYAYSP